MYNAGINAAVIAAGTGSSQQATAQALLKKLTSAKAFGPTSAIPLLPDGPGEEKALAELVGTATVRPWSGGYYLDRDRKRARDQQQGWIALVVGLAIVSILVSVFALLAL